MPKKDQKLYFIDFLMVVCVLATFCLLFFTGFRYWTLNDRIDRLEESIAKTELVKIASAKENIQDAIKLSNAYYDRAFNKLCWLFGIGAAFIGLAIPIYSYVIQKQSLKDEKDKIEEEFQELIEEETKKLKKLFEEETKKLKKQIEDTEFTLRSKIGKFR
jgi:flagellar motility protein MotE (MotC chaperone)